MAASPPVPRLTDIITAIELIRSETADVTLQAFESDMRKRWLVERGIEIISEASRHLGDELKARHPEIPESCSCLTKRADPDTSLCRHGRQDSRR